MNEQHVLRPPTLRRGAAAIRCRLEAGSKRRLSRPARAPTAVLRRGQRGANLPDGARVRRRGGARVPVARVSRRVTHRHDSRLHAVGMSVVVHSHHNVHYYHAFSLGAPFLPFLIIAAEKKTKPTPRLSQRIRGLPQT